jgi:4'-phosphopantetheinyl transferase
VVEVWSASLEPPSGLATQLEDCLSPDEQARAGRFVAPRDRARFIAARSFLRRLLARHVGARPAELRFHYGPHGKPVLADRGAELRFNLAHSDALAVCALGVGPGDLGVDVERVKPLRDLQALSRTAFSPRERARLESLPEPQQLRAFYEAWTRKEAFLKALGCGLGRPLDSFDVAFGPGESPRLVWSISDPDEPIRFALHAFEPKAGYIGAVAVAGEAALALRLQTWQWM